METNISPDSSAVDENEPSRIISFDKFEIAYALDGKGFQSDDDNNVCPSLTADIPRAACEQLEKYHFRTKLCDCPEQSCNCRRDLHNDSSSYAKLNNDLSVSAVLNSCALQHEINHDSFDGRLKGTYSTLCANGTSALISSKSDYSSIISKTKDDYCADCVIDFHTAKNDEQANRNEHSYSFINNHENAATNQENSYSHLDNSNYVAVNQENSYLHHKHKNAAANQENSCTHMNNHKYSADNQENSNSHFDNHKYSPVNQENCLGYEKISNENRSVGNIESQLIIKTSSESDGSYSQLQSTSRHNLMSSCDYDCYSQTSGKGEKCNDANNYQHIHISIEHVSELKVGEYSEIANLDISPLEDTNYSELVPHEYSEIVSSSQVSNII